MTPRCCDRAWAKATGHEVFEHEGMWAYLKGERLLKDEWGVPAPTSAEWLAEIVEALWRFETDHTVSIDPAIRIFVRFRVKGEQASAFGPDLRRALCAALNGSPCERKAA